MKTELMNEYPEIFKEWDYDRNEHTPQQMTRGSQKKVWWIGSCGHEWETKFRDRIRTKSGRITGCPYCANPPKILRGFNDLWTTNPEIASMLANAEDGYKYMLNSKKRVDWICPNCKSLVKNKMFSNVSNWGLSCNYCSEKVSIAERIMSSYLRELNIEFEYQKTFKWIRNRFYDFYLSDFDMIVETHGRRHYDDGYKGELVKRQKMDREKEDSARKMLKGDYVVIDCKRNNIEYIKKSIEDSVLDTLSKSECRWHIVAKNSATDKMRVTWDLWNDGMSLQEISDETNIDITTVYEYLKHGYIARECSYTSKATKVNHHSKRAVVQLSLVGDYIATWDSLKEGAKSIGIDKTSLISRCINHHDEQAHGFKWLYLSEYENSIQV